MNWLWGTFGLLTIASTLAAQQPDPYKLKPENHEKNRALSAAADKANLEKHRNDTNYLVLPGLVADKQGQRIEIMAESTKLSPGAACEFGVIDEASQHAYEALIVSFAKPSAVHKALRFIGKEAGEPADPASLRYWAKGECFLISIRAGNEAPVRLEKLVMDRRTGKTPPEQGFRFTGSRMAPAIGAPTNEVYAADEYQPMSIISLFNTPYSVFEVPYTASKDEVYRNTVINPEQLLTNGGVLTLVIEPLAKENARQVKDLVLQVRNGTNVASKPLSGLELIKNLNFQLKDSTNTLNKAPTLSSVMEALGPLDRTKKDYFLTVDLGDEVNLGSAQALARILSIIDCERGIRIDPPPAGQLLYRAFAPDIELLDRDARFYHPLELSLSEKDGAVSGRLLRVDSVWKSGASQSELQFMETPVANAGELRRELDADAQPTRTASKVARPRVIMVFAPSSLKYGQLRKFLELAMTTHRTMHVYVDVTMPPIPAKKP